MVADGAEAIEALDAFDDPSDLAEKAFARLRKRAIGRSDADMLLLDKAWESLGKLMVKTGRRRQ